MFYSLGAMLLGALGVFAVFEGGSAIVASVAKPGGVYVYQASPIQTINPSSQKKLQTAEVLFVGDIMTDRAVRRRVEARLDGSYERLFEKVPELKEADITFGNLEGPVSDKGENVGSIYSFRMDPQTVPALRSSGFDIVSVANNHAGDWSFTAFVDTLERLNQGGVHPVGGAMSKQEARTPIIFNVDGISIGFLAFTDTGPDWLEADEKAGILLASDPKRLEYIREARAQVDHLIVSYHFGDEYEFGSNERQQELSRSSIDAGARVIVGHHPHVIQEVEQYGDGLIFYSLGNFIFDQYFSEETMTGMVARVFFTKEGISSWTEMVSEQDEFLRPVLKNSVTRKFNY